MRHRDLSRDLRQRRQAQYKPDYADLRRPRITLARWRCRLQALGAARICQVSEEHVFRSSVRNDRSWNKPTIEGARAPPTALCELNFRPRDSGQPTESGLQQPVHRRGGSGSDRARREASTVVHWRADARPRRRAAGAGVTGPTAGSIHHVRRRHWQCCKRAPGHRWRERVPCMLLHRSINISRDADLQPMSFDCEHPPAFDAVRGVELLNP